jgi:hypothetical protein
MLIAQHVLEQIAKNHGSRILEAQEYDPNICSFVHDPKNRAQLIAKTGQPLLRKTAFDFRDLRVQLFANNSYVRIMLFRELTEVFSLNRIDKIAGLRPAGIIAISGRIYQLATQGGLAASGPTMLQTPPFLKMLDAIAMTESESLHVYRNGLAVYLYRPDPARVERIIEAAATFSSELRLT